jgi:hypothetical protein
MTSDTNAQRKKRTRKKGPNEKLKRNGMKCDGDTKRKRERGSRVRFLVCCVTLPATSTCGCFDDDVGDVNGVGRGARKNCFRLRGLSVVVAVSVSVSVSKVRV